MESQLSYIKKPELLEELKRFESAFFAVIDTKVKDHLPDWIKASKSVLWITNPEESKNLRTFEQGLNFFLDLGISRQSTLIAIGGGATTDLAGYIAASLLRGINWISIPTTLLAMVDGSIGGKVALNMSQGKNLVGAFHAPVNVLICHDFLVTLPEDEWISGKGEILKYAFLSEKIANLVLNKAEMDVIALECAHYKKQVVDKDFKEAGDRIFLNLGHTLGHAFESTLKISHGLSVAMGLGYLFELLGLNERKAEWSQLCSALDLPLDRLQLPQYSQFSVEKFKNYLSQDKKKADADIRLVLVHKIGSPFVDKIKLTDLLLKIEGHRDFKN